MIKIKTALLSVYDKSGIISLAETLIKNHVEILSSGGTANFLKENGIEVTEVSDYTGSPEMFGGRVKTLHPKIHAGILARDENDISELESMGAKKIDLVVVNLYPFGDELKKPDATENDLIEKILRTKKIMSVKVEYNKKIFNACLKISELSNEMKSVKVFLKFSS